MENVKKCWHSSQFFFFYFSCFICRWIESNKHNKSNPWTHPAQMKIVD